MATYQKCPCCSHNDLSIILTHSFFNTNILQCNNCFYKFNDLSDKNNDFIPNFYKKSYWDGSLRTKNRIRQFGRKILLHCRARSHYLSLPKNILSILEIGAGLGISSNYFSKHGLSVTAIEPDISNISKIQTKNKSINTILGTYDDVHLEKTFDLVYVSHVFEHVVDINFFLNKIKSNTKKDGLIFIEVPNCTTLSRTKASCMEPHLSYFTRESLENLVKKSNLKIVHLDSYYISLPKNIFPSGLKLFLYYIFRKDIYHKTNDQNGNIFKMILKNP